MSARPFETFVGRLEGVRRLQDGSVMAKCPAHENTTPSLHVSKADDGRVLTHDFGENCSFEQIVFAMGLNSGDAFLQNRSYRPDTIQQRPHLVRTPGITVSELAKAKTLPEGYLRGEFGLSEFKSRGVLIPYRTEDKKLAPRQRIRTALIAKKGSLWLPGPGSPIAYALWKLPEARNARFLHLVEGESDTWTLWFHGYPALGIPGAGMAQLLAAENLTGIDKVFIHQEPDGAGAKFATGLDARLDELGFEGEVFILHFSKETKDANALHCLIDGDKVRFAEEFERLITQADRWDPGHLRTRIAASTEDDIALTFAERHAQDLRYVAKWNRWYFWDGRRWLEDNSLAAFDRSRVICREFGDSAGNERLRATLKAARTIAAVASLARSDRRIVAVPEQFDVDPWLLNTPGGLVDLRTGQIRPNRREEYVTKSTAVAPAESVKCPLWQGFLESVMHREEPAHTAALIDYLSRLCGYCLTGDTREAAVFFAHGVGANGKTTFARTLGGILGDYATTTAGETFMQSKVERHPTELAALTRARLVTASEVPLGRAWAETRLKELTGGDPIAARFMRGDFFTFTPVFKPLILGNHKPAIRSVDEAIRRRLHLIPFAVVIPESQRDRAFAENYGLNGPAFYDGQSKDALNGSSKG